MSSVEVFSIGKQKQPNSPFQSLQTSISQSRSNRATFNTVSLIRHQKYKQNTQEHHAGRQLRQRLHWSNKRLMWQNVKVELLHHLKVELWLYYTLRAYSKNRVYFVHFWNSCCSALGTSGGESRKKNTCSYVWLLIWGRVCVCVCVHVCGIFTPIYQPDCSRVYIPYCTVNELYCSVLAGAGGKCGEG